MKPESNLISIALESPHTDTPHTLEIPAKCGGCGLPNFNIWGTMIRGKLKIEVRCIRCGSIQSIINTPPDQGEE